MKPIEDQDLVIHVLNVGFGDTTIIEFPAEPDADGNMIRSYGLVDCRDADKTRKYLLTLAARRPATTQLTFLCVTHPHVDHISGVREMILDESFTPRVFWDCGFRHSSQTYRGVLMALQERNVPLERVASGMECYFGTVRVTALAPSVTLRNQYGNYGIDINNASIVLRLENRAADSLTVQSTRHEGKPDSDLNREAGQSTMILGSDAQIESWELIAKEFPQVQRASGLAPQVQKMLNLLACRVLKVPHYGSMRSSPLDMYERMCPALAIVSIKQEPRSKPRSNGEHGLLPHPATALALAQVGAKVMMIDGSMEKDKSGKPCGPASAHEGSVVVVIPPGGVARWRKLGDRENQLPEIVDAV
jgi:beta-lactamase superfamily II metal-dependent hydrolase